MVFPKILVIDACPVNRALYRSAFSNKQYDLEYVDNLSAYRKAAQWWQPDLIFLDLHRTQAMDAHLIAKIRKVSEDHIPIVVTAPMVSDTLQQLVQSFGVDAAYSTLQGMNQISMVADRIMSGQSLLDKGRT